MTCGTRYWRSTSPDLTELARAVLPCMLQRQSGAIVNVASEAAFRGSAAGVAYTVSKHAVVGLTKSSAFMYAEVAFASTPLPRSCPYQYRRAIRFPARRGAHQHRHRRRPPEAVEAEASAASITFLLSDDAVNINGAILPSDGGWSVQ